MCIQTTVDLLKTSEKWFKKIRKELELPGKMRIGSFCRNGINDRAMETAEKEAESDFYGKAKASV